MDVPLKSLWVNDRQLDQLRAGAETLLHILFNMSDCKYGDNEKSLSEYDSYI